MKRVDVSAAEDTPITSERTTNDTEEKKRLIMVVRGGGAAGEGREAWSVTLQSGREMVLLIPNTVANELATQHGYIGRIRPVTDDDNVEIEESHLATRERRREATKGGAIK